MTVDGSVPRRARESLLARVAIELGVIVGFAAGVGFVGLARRPLASAAESRTEHALVAEPANGLASGPAAACVPAREMPAFAWPRGRAISSVGSRGGDDVDRAAAPPTSSDWGAGGAP
jgi:hypothetical protein